MKLKNTVKASFLRRYMRFLVDAKLENGEIVVAHTSNTGSMLSCLEENAEIRLIPNNNPNRKTKYDWELIQMNGVWIGINTQCANDLAEFFVKSGIFTNFMPDFKLLKREYKYLDSRFDIYLESENEKGFVEVKNVTYKLGDTAFFPDAPSLRGQKHLQDLIKSRAENYRAAMFYLITRNDVAYFSPAEHIDKQYALLFYKAIEAGVEIYPIRVSVCPEGYQFDKLLPIK